MIKIGSLVQSSKGHDLGRIYVVTKFSQEFAFCVDGEYRMLDNPKKKRIKHLKNLHIYFDDVEKLRDNKLYDFEIKTFISIHREKSFPSN